LAWDRYLFTLGNPLKYTDPSGHSTEIPPFCIEGCQIWDYSSVGGSGLGGRLLRAFISTTTELVDFFLTNGTTYTDPKNSTWNISGIEERTYAGMFPPTALGVVVNLDNLGSSIIANLGKETTEPVFLSKTRWNFRKNLQRLTGKGLDDIVGMEAHHVLPQQFAPDFAEAGINIHDPVFGSWVDASAHRGWSYTYNQRWSEFLENTRTREEILNFARDLAKEYQFDVHFGSP
jgi:hypothetical protein